MTCRLPALVAALTLLAAPALGQDRGDRVRVQLTDGTEICAVVLEAATERLLLRATFGEVSILRTDIEVLELGTELRFKPYRLALDRRYEATRTDAARFRRRFLPVVQFRDYTEGRLQLTDSRYRWIGPPSLGYSSRLLGKYNRKSFRIVVAGVPHEGLDVDTVLALSGDEALVAKVAEGRLQAQRTVGTGLLLLGGGTLGMVLGAVLNSVGEPLGPMTGEPYGAPVMGLSIPLFVVGAIFVQKGGKDLEDLRGTNLAKIMTRRQAWALVERENARLRRELGLPDDDRLDAP